jgi:predicted DNA-binding protein
MNDDRLPPIRIPKEIKKRLVQLAQEDGRTLSDYVRRALEFHLESVKCLEELVNNDK